MPPIAYALREDFAGTVEQIVDGQAVEVPIYTGGIISAGERDIDVRAELDSTEDGAHAGLIVVEDHDFAAVAALDAYPVLKRVPAPEEATLDVDEYEAQGMAALRALAGVREIGGANTARKPDLVTALHAQDARVQAGDPAPDGGWTVDNLIHPQADGAGDDTTPEA